MNPHHKESRHLGHLHFDQDAVLSTGGFGGSGPISNKTTMVRTSHDDDKEEEEKRSCKHWQRCALVSSLSP